MILTVPNLVSLVRIALIPVFVWLLVGRDDPTAAGLLLGLIGSTDWVDGYLARRLGQVSELGKLLDPIADRAAVVTALLTGWATGVVPAWFSAAVLTREALVIAGTAWAATRRGVRIPVRRVGKVATFGIYFALPAFMVYAGGAGEFFRWFAWAIGIPGLALYWLAAALYAGDVLALVGRDDGRVSSELRETKEPK